MKTALSFELGAGPISFSTERRHETLSIRTLIWGKVKKIFTIKIRFLNIILILNDLISIINGCEIILFMKKVCTIVGKDNGLMVVLKWQHNVHGFSTYMQHWKIYLFIDF